MKIDKHMTIVIGGRVYKAPGVTRIEIKGADFEMDYEWGRFTLKCNTSDVELFTDKPSMTDVLLPDETGYIPHPWETNAEKRFFDSTREQIENDNEVEDSIKSVFLEATGGRNNKPKTAVESSSIDRERALFTQFGIRRDYTGKYIDSVVKEYVKAIESIERKVFDEVFKDIIRSGGD